VRNLTPGELHWVLKTSPPPGPSPKERGVATQDVLITFYDYVATMTYCTRPGPPLLRGGAGGGDLKATL